MTITINYPGLLPVTIPVDETKTLVGLELVGLNATTPFEIPRLNNKVALPAVYALFNDGTKTEVGTQFKVNYSIGSGATGILNVDQSGNLLATTVIPVTTPISVNISLTNLPTVNTTVLVSSKDAAPDVSFNIPSTIEVSNLLIIQATANDDVSIREVQFFLDGTILGTKKIAPYEMTIATTEQMVNRVLEVGVVAIDSLGQASPLLVKNVNVKAKSDKSVPELIWESPIELQRIVEGAPLKMALVREVDINDKTKSNAIK